MALTLAESAKLATDMVLAGVMETIVKEEHILDELPFIEVVGNNFVYNRLNAEPGISFFNVGDAWTESTPDFTQVSVPLKILGATQTSTTSSSRRASTCRTWKRR